jgi:hypothetical protein
MSETEITGGVCLMSPRVVPPQELLPVMERLITALREGAKDCVQRRVCTDLFIDAVQSAEKATRYLRRAVDSPNTAANSLAELRGPELNPVGGREEPGVAIDDFLRHTKTLLIELTSHYHESLNIMEVLPAMNVTKEGGNRYELVETGDKEADQVAQSEFDDSRTVYFHLTRIERRLDGGDFFIDDKGWNVGKSGNINVEGSLRAALGCEK